MSAEQIEKVIESVRSHPELYDTGHKDYKSTKFKEDIWAEIALECQSENASSVKKLWKKLRDSHREFLKRLQTKSGQAMSTTKKWWFHDEMSFLEKFMTKLDAQSHIDEVSENVIISNEESGSINEINSYVENIQNTKEKTKEDEIISLIKSNIRQQNIEPANKALHNFFMSMYETTLTLPQHFQREAKRKVFNVISELEEQTSYDHSSPRISSTSPPFSTPKIPNVEISRSTPAPYIEEDSFTTSSHQRVRISMSDMHNMQKENNMSVSHNDKSSTEDENFSTYFYTCKTQDVDKEKQLL